jgi:hypothetical protein
MEMVRKKEGFFGECVVCGMREHKQIKEFFSDSRVPAEVQPFYNDAINRFMERPIYNYLA